MALLTILPFLLPPFLLTSLSSFLWHYLLFLSQRSICSGPLALNIHSYPHLCRLLLRSLLCLRTAELLRRGVLLRLLRLADSTDAGNSIFAEICTVAVLSGLVRDALVDPAIDPSVSNLPSKYLSNPIYLSNFRRYEVILTCGWMNWGPRSR